jgi:CHASE1-domain containing sensor protein
MCENKRHCQQRILETQVHLTCRMETSIIEIVATTTTPTTDSNSSSDLFEDVNNNSNNTKVLKFRNQKRDFYCAVTIIFLVVLIVMGSGVGLAIGLFFNFKNSSENSNEHKFRLVATSNVAVLRGMVQDALRIGAAIRTFVSLNYNQDYYQSVSFEDWAAFTGDTEATISQVVNNWDYAPIVFDSNRDQFETYARSLSVLGNYSISDVASRQNRTVAPRREAYMPVLFITPLESNLVVLGFDVLHTPIRAIPIIKAAQTRKPTLSSRITLFQDNSYG